MANSIMCKEATQKRNLRVISNRRVNEASGVRSRLLFASGVIREMMGSSCAVEPRPN